MRLPIHLDTFDRVNSVAFAILWLDNKTRARAPVMRNPGLPVMGRAHLAGLPGCAQACQEVRHRYLVVRSGAGCGAARSRAFGHAPLGLTHAA
ncbi:DUF3564 family protein [Paraburkholderia fungorum]|uniref:DUF3564 family protein n=1 Tax=Paraburkholderia TaxID=1822464 RepID=UPI0038BAF3FB